MAKKAISAIITMIIIVFSFIIAAPITLLSINLSSYGKIDKSFTYKYVRSSPPSLEKLNFYVDIGNIEIQYVDPPVDYFVKIYVNIEMAGSGLAGKKYSDYFDIIEGNITSSPINFSIKFLSDIYDPEVSSLIKDVSIMVSLRKDIIFDISATVIKGNVDIKVPFNVHINNVKVNITSGNTLFDLSNCIIEGNVTGIGNHSKIELRTHEVQYTRNSTLYFKNRKGEIKFDINQSTEMGADIKIIGEIETFDARIHVVYNDYSSNIGALVTLNHWEGYFPHTCTYVGFDYEVVNTIPRGYNFTSYDYPNINNYNISLYKKKGTPSYEYYPYYWNLYSEPN